MMEKGKIEFTDPLFRATSKSQVKRIAAQTEGRIVTTFTCSHSREGCPYCATELHDLRESLKGRWIRTADALPTVVGHYHWSRWSISLRKNVVNTRFFDCGDSDRKYFQTEQIAWWSIPIATKPEPFTEKTDER